jgi:hypothetical protein
MSNNVWWLDDILLQIAHSYIKNIMFNSNSYSIPCPWQSRHNKRCLSLNLNATTFSMTALFSPNQMEWTERKRGAQKPTNLPHMEPMKGNQSGPENKPKAMFLPSLPHHVYKRFLQKQQYERTWYLWAW